MALRVLIAGGGLGGLTLAHGLRSAGLQPAVFERGPADVDLSTSYRIHIDPNGSRALHRCLPADPVARLRGALRRRAARHRLRHRTPAPARLRPRERPSDVDSAERSHPDQPLRPAPAAVQRPGGRPHVRQARRRLRPARQTAGSSSTSRTARRRTATCSSAPTAPLRQFASSFCPSARVVDTGVAGIAGKVYLDDRIRRVVGERLLQQMTMVLPARGFGMFLAPFQRDAARAASDRRYSTCPSTCSGS